MEKMEVAWKRGYRYASKADPADVLNELERVRKKNGGELTPEAVIEAAKSTRTKLHRFFTWDDSEAADEFRKNEARHLIRSIEVVRVEAPDVGATRHYEIQRSRKIPSRKAYNTIDNVLSDSDSRAELLKRALSELLSIRRRYSKLQELAIVFRQIDEVLETAE